MKRKTKAHGPTTKTIAANIRRLRLRAGLTRRDLANMTGGALTLDAIQKIENAAAAEERIVRHVTTDELVLLAVALGVTPNALLLPPTVKGEVEVTGVGKLSARDAWRWARGRNRLPQEAERIYVGGDDDEEDATFDAIEREKDMQFRRENAPDDPPLPLPSDMSPEQMNAVLAVVEAVKAAQKVGVDPRSVAKYVSEAPAC